MAGPASVYVYPEGPGDVVLSPVKVRRPHSKQKALVQSPFKWTMVRAGRRSGKTTGLAIRALRQFLKAWEDMANGGKGRGGRILYAAPTTDQTQRFWAEIRRSMRPLEKSGLVRINSSMKFVEVVEYPQLRIRAQTAWNADTLRGDYDDLLIFDEWQLMDEATWEEVGAPMLLDTNGDAIFLYTPPSIVSKGVSKAQNKFHAAQMFKEKKLDPKWLCLHFTSMDNPYLSQEAFANVASVMSRQAYRREIMAEDLEEAPGAFWTRALFEDREIRRSAPVDEFVRIVVGVDPMGSSSAGGECGIVVVGLHKHGWACVLKDLSEGGLKPKEWGKVVCNAYDFYNADAVIAENNFGGDMVLSNINTVYEKEGAQQRINVRSIRASKGKAARAEPVSSLYYQRQVYHAEEFSHLEDQYCMWEPDSGDSPDRLDAAVWGITFLMLGPSPEPVVVKPQPPARPRRQGRRSRRRDD